MISQVADLLGDDKRFKFVVAGRLTGETAKEFVARKDVTFLGELSNSEALRLAARSFLVFTLYDPVFPINQHAEPNKWGDCAVVGVPFIVNDEVITATPYLARNAAIGFPYLEPEKAAAEIRALADDPSRRALMVEAIREMKSRSFDDVVRAELVPLLITSRTVPTEGDGWESANDTRGQPVGK